MNSDNRKKVWTLQYFITLIIQTKKSNLLKLLKPQKISSRFQPKYLSLIIKPQTVRPKTDI